MMYDDSEWNGKGATLSDKTARKEYGLSQDEIVKAIKCGRLDYRQNASHGNPYLRLLRREVEELVKHTLGNKYLKEVKLKTELSAVTRELRKLKKQVVQLEKRKAELEADLDG